MLKTLSTDFRFLLKVIVAALLKSGYVVTAADVDTVECAGGWRVRFTVVIGG